MKSIDYVYDLRDQLESLILPADDEIKSLTRDIFGDRFMRFAFEDDHSYLFPVHSIKVGHIMYGDSADILTASEFHKLQLIHKYNGIHFFRWLDGPKAGKVEVVADTSLYFRKCLYPIRVIVPDGVVMDCCCPQTEIVNAYDGPCVKGKREEI